MNFSKINANSINLEMETEDQYKLKAKNYRSSEEYSKMISLYPILKSSINECKDEILVA